MSDADIARALDPFGPYQAGDALGPRQNGLSLPLTRALAEDPSARPDAARLRELLRGAIEEEGAARDDLAERFGLEGERDTVPPAPPEGAPAMGLPLENVTREQLLPEARASYATYYPGEDRPSWADSTEDDAFHDDPFAPLDAEGTRVDTSLEDLGYAAEPGDTTEVVLPDALDEMPDMPGYADLPELPTVVHGHHLPSIAPPGDLPDLPPLERTLQLPMPDVPSAPSPRASVPTMPPSSFRVTAPMLEDPRASAPQKQPMMVAGWPVTWLVGLGAGAVALVALVAVLTAFLASC